MTMRPPRLPAPPCLGRFVVCTVHRIWPISLVVFVTCSSLRASAASLEWQNGSGYRSARVYPSGERPGFALLSGRETGVTFTNHLSQDRHLTNQILLNGSGVAAGDVDGDGWCDLFLCGIERPNALYRNLGNWRFEEITNAVIALPGASCTGAVLADLDGDRDLDLLVNSVGGGTHLFLNDGQGRFKRGPILNVHRAGMSSALADIDGDGDLDLYVANYRTVTIRDQPNTRFNIRRNDGQPQVVSIDGRPLTEPDLTNRFVFRFSESGGTGTFAYDENGEEDALFLNDGGGRFTPLPVKGAAFPDESGKPLRDAPLDWGLSAMFRDVNGDGAPDLYVCNDFKSPDRLWLNDGRGHFQAAAPLTLRQISLSSMGVDFADINRDGWDDFLVVDMLSRDHIRRMTQRIDIKPEVLPPGTIENRPQYPRNTLFLNREDGTYAEVSQLAGLESSEWSWTPIFLDVDLDGYEDLLVSNGFERDGMNVDVLRRLELMKKEKPLSSVEQLRLRSIYPRLDTPNLAFRNQGDLTFRDMSDAWGFNQRAVSQGMALADLDNDGDLDVVINNLNGSAFVLRNEAPGPRIAVRLKGRAPNTRGIGAKIKVTGGPVAQSQEMIVGGRYLSSDDSMRVFAVGSATNLLTIEVFWRDGRRSVVANASANHVYEIDEVASTATAPVAHEPSPSPLFVDVSSRLNHIHHEDSFDDFTQQPSLMRRLSQLGPGLSWFDCDGDGWEDLLIGSGAGGKLRVFKNDGRGGFLPAQVLPLIGSAESDQTGIVATRTGAGGVQIVVGAGGASTGPGNLVATLYRLDGAAPANLTGPAHSSTGPLAMADVNGDGRLDLFVGGRCTPGRYPEVSPSLLFLGTDNGFETDQQNLEVLVNAGLVSGAVFSDLDNDGDPELILACDWGPIKIFRNRSGRLTEWDAPVLTNRQSRTTLQRLTGFWDGVTTGDFDGDGRMDIAASNWGRNTRFEHYRREPIRLYHGDLLGNGVVQTIEGYSEPSTGRLLPLQPFHVMGLAMPTLRERLGTFESYARATLPEIYSDTWRVAKELVAVWLESTVFLNRGDYFEAEALPIEAQLAPGFAVCAGDLDGDGNEDLFLSQNFFAVHPEIARYDAGRGLVLRGDGRGRFQPMPGQRSGILTYGEQRGAAMCDFDQDGRVDLAVAQNAANTKLYRNATGGAGLRIRLSGTPGNPFGVGAMLRLVTATGAGPAREIHAGSGYWSQDSAVQVLATFGLPARLEIQWPGGAKTAADVPASAREVRVDSSGNLTVSK